MKCLHENTSTETTYDHTGREVAFKVCEVCGVTVTDLGLTGERV